MQPLQRVVIGGWPEKPHLRHIYGLNSKHHDLANHLLVSPDLIPVTLSPVLIGAGTQSKILMARLPRGSIQQLVRTIEAKQVTISPGLIRSEKASEHVRGVMLFNWITTPYLVVPKLNYPDPPIPSDPFLIRKTSLGGELLPSQALIS